MKQKFAQHYLDSGKTFNENWTVEQICDAIVEAGLDWPEELTNEEGWQLWTAVMRRSYKVQSIQWNERIRENGEESGELEVKFRLEDKRDFTVSIERETLLNTDFGKVCRDLEVRLNTWKVKDDAEREEALRAADEAWEQRAPDSIEYVIGFRQWNLSGNRLKPIGAGNDVWEGGKEVRASCGSGRLHRAPDHDCECGLYAWHSWTGLSPQSGSATAVFGAVQACGRMEMHTTGFRAEFMRPVLLGYDDSEDRMTVDGLTRGPDYGRVLELAQQLGGIEVVPFAVMTTAAREFGLLVEDHPEFKPPKGKS